jgi:hypothetical protein
MRRFLSRCIVGPCASLLKDMLLIAEGSVVAVSIARLFFFMMSDPSSPDIFWDLTNSDIYSITELNIALVSGKS